MRESWVDEVYYVESILLQGLGRLSEKITVKVKPEDVPMDLRAKDVTTHTMTLTWSPPIKLNPINYQVRKWNPQRYRSCKLEHNVDASSFSKIGIIRRVQRVRRFGRCDAISTSAQTNAYSTTVGRVFLPERFVTLHHVQYKRYRESR